MYEQKIGKLGAYVKSLTNRSFGDTVIAVEKLLENGFTEQVFMGEVKFAIDDECFLRHQDYEILTITGGAGECLSVTIE